MVFEGHIMLPQIFEVSLKVKTKVYLDVLKSVVIPGAIRQPVADPGCGSRTRHRPRSPKRPRLGFRRSATTLYPSLTGPLLPRPEPAGLLPLIIRREHHQHDLPQHQSQRDRRHQPSIIIIKLPELIFFNKSFKIKLQCCFLQDDNFIVPPCRCQLYYIIKLPELIFFNKSFNIKLQCCFLQDDNFIVPPCRCQLYYIIKLPELIFFNKSLI